MKDKFETILENKQNYFGRCLNRFSRAFKPVKPVTPLGEKPTVTIPRAFRNIDPSDQRWAQPQRLMPVFQKMLMHIPETSRRVAVLNNLIILTDSTNKPYIDGHRMSLQDQIFRGITGHHYGEPLTGASFYKITHDDLQSRDFFRLIGMGIHAYESISPEKRERFNQAVMPKVKKQDITVPYRLQQYVK